MTVRVFPTALVMVAAAMGATGCALVVGDLPEPYEGTDASADVVADASSDGVVDANPDTEIEAALDVQPDVPSDVQADVQLDAGLDVDAADTGLCPKPCDCDDDGVQAKGACGGTDCDDDDGLVHTGQTAYFTEASDSVGYDYDCSGLIERDPAVDVELACVGLSLAFCETSKQGFVAGVPLCGESGDWGTCKASGLSCVPDVHSQQVVGCH